MPIRKIGDKWEARIQIRKRCNNKGELQKFKQSFRSARADADRRLAAARGRRHEYCSIRDRLEEFLTASRIGLGRRPCREKTLEHHRRRLLAFDASFRSAPLDAITTHTLEKWIQRRLAAGVQPDTVNADLVSLRAFARWAVRKGYAPDVLPLLTVDRLHVPGKLPGSNRKPPKAMEMGELLRHIRAISRERHDMGLFLRGMMLFGLRPVEVAELRREDVKLPWRGDPGRLHTRGVKGVFARDIPVEADSQQEHWLRQCLALGGTFGLTRLRAPLVHCIGGKSRLRPGGWTTESLDMALSRLCRKLGMKFTAYQVRHSVISHLQAAGHSLATVQQYAGHMKVTTQTAYSHRHAREAAAAYTAVSEALAAFRP